MIKEKIARVAFEGKERKKPLAHAIGRRKTAVARVWLRPAGTGRVVVNGKNSDIYFDTSMSRMVAITPLSLFPGAQGCDFDVTVQGGGKVGQADAVKLGISRALLEWDGALKPALRQKGLLTVDARNKERKKYGRRGARRSFQFVKR